MSGGRGLAKVKRVLSEPEFDRFCIEELAPCALDIRQAVAALSGGTEISAKGRKAQVSEILSELERLREAEETLARSLRLLVADRAADTPKNSPLILVNQVGTSPKYAIEGVLAKVAEHLR